MEQVDGGSLHKRLQEKTSPLKEDEAVHYFLQMVAVVLFLAQNKIVHRDLKPANILLREKSIALIDFGLSRESAESMIELGT